MSDIVERLRAAKTLGARTPTLDGDGIFEIVPDRLCLEAADEIERLRQWQADACDNLEQYARYAYVIDDIRELLERANQPLPDWLVAE